MSIMQEYLYKIFPQVDTTALNDARQKIQDSLTGGIKGAMKAFNLSESIKSQIAALDKQISSGKLSAKDLREAEDSKVELLEQLTELQDTQNLKLGEFASGAAVAGEAISTGIKEVYTIIKEGVGYAKKIADYGSKISNKFISGSSIFLDTNIRSTMAKLGVSSDSAQALNFALEQLDTNLGEAAYWTDAQRAAIQGLTDQYMKGLGSIDKVQLAKYKETAQLYQLAQARLNTIMQTAIIKVFAESKGFRRMTNSLIKFLDTLGDFAQSPIIQWLFDGMTNLLSGIVNIGNALLSLANKLSFGIAGKSVPSGNTYNFWQENNNNISGATNPGDVANSLTYEQTKQLSYYGGSQ